MYSFCWIHFRKIKLLVRIYTIYILFLLSLGTMHIECSNYQGRDRRTIYSLASYPFGLAYANNIFYWTDWDM